MELIEALRTTGAAREFTDEPVTRAELYDLLDIARFAPNGGNRQGWRVIVAEDPEVRRVVRDCYVDGWREYVAQLRAGLVPFAPVTDDAAEAAAIEAAATADPGPEGFAERLDAAPALLVLVADLRALAAVDKDAPHYSMAGGASVYPFAWSILLAARAVGLGGVITTMALRREAPLRAALRIDDDHIVAGIVVLGHPVAQPTRLRRAAVEAFATVDAADGEPLRP